MACDTKPFCFDRCGAISAFSANLPKNRKQICITFNKLNKEVIQ